MIVMKFGGTSVESARAMNNVIDIIARERSRRPIVVLSAVSGATNDLLKSAHLALDGNIEESTSILNNLLDRHVTIAENLIGDRPSYQQVLQFCKRQIEELRNLCRGVAILGELTNRSLDAFASVGERMSTLILSEGMKQRGLPVELVDARTCMITDDYYTSASPLFDQINSKIPEALNPHLRAGKIVITQGFIGSSQKGVTTTLGRGGSDYSASLIGAALDVEEIQIWTDVDGVLTADPRIAPKAQKLRIISFREASELAYFGAKVLHPSTILPAVKKNIPVIVLNSLRPTMSGTRIVAQPPKTNVSVKSIASKTGITVINIQSTRMLMAHGFLESIFEVFNRHKTSVDLVTTSEVAVSLTIDNSSQLESIVAELRRFSDVAIYDKKAIICIVGDQMHSTSGVADRIFRALGNINVMMISQGASEINMSLVIEDTAVTEAVQRLHAEFFEPVPDADLFEAIGGNGE
jgi:aspartate kinase